MNAECDLAWRSRPVYDAVRCGAVRLLLLLLLLLLCSLVILIVCPFKRQGRLEASIKRLPVGSEA